MRVSPVEQRLAFLEAEVERLKRLPRAAWLRIKEVCAECGFSRSTLYNRLADPRSKFPKPSFNPGPEWLAADIEAWKANGHG